MISRATKGFWKAFDRQPQDIQSKAEAIYRAWRRNPLDPTFQFKCIHSAKSVYSVRIGFHWRAVGVKRDEYIIWFWIGSHADYDGLISRL